MSKFVKKIIPGLIITSMMTVAVSEIDEVVNSDIHTAYAQENSSMAELESKLLEAEKSLMEDSSSEIDVKYNELCNLYNHLDQTSASQELLNRILYVDNYNKVLSNAEIKVNYAQGQYLLSNVDCAELQRNINNAKTYIQNQQSVVGNTIRLNQEAVNTKNLFYRLNRIETYVASYTTIKNSSAADAISYLSENAGDFSAVEFNNLYTIVWQKVNGLSEAQKNTICIEERYTLNQGIDTLGQFVRSSSDIESCVEHADDYSSISEARNNISTILKVLPEKQRCSKYPLFTAIYNFDSGEFISYPNYIKYQFTVLSKKELKKLYDNNKEKINNNYTIDSWNAFTSALNNAK
ncbi:hypothetical protein [uncultured Clostridium sp.]|uniref:hypothetical protein n=1 Tax=uncultured Clostridium sp. TaxID=59620 RepID=UPI0025D9A349|nr:hypothetical protein [uncultured Clostridium sp.]